MRFQWLEFIFREGNEPVRHFPGGDAGIDKLHRMLNSIAFLRGRVTCKRDKA
jgi:hypothetical protein